MKHFISYILFVFCFNCVLVADVEKIDFNSIKIEEFREYISKIKTNTEGWKTWEKIFQVERLDLATEFYQSTEYKSYLSDFLENNYKSKFNLSIIVNILKSPWYGDVENGVAKEDIERVRTPTGLFVCGNTIYKLFPDESENLKESGVSSKYRDFKYRKKIAERIEREFLSINQSPSQTVITPESPTKPPATLPSKASEQKDQSSSIQNNGSTTNILFWLLLTLIVIIACRAMFNKNTIS